MPTKTINTKPDQTPKTRTQQAPNTFKKNNKAKQETQRPESFSKQASITTYLREQQHEAQKSIKQAGKPATDPKPAPNPFKKAQQDRIVSKQESELDAKLSAFKNCLVDPEEGLVRRKSLITLDNCTN